MMKVLYNTCFADPWIQVAQKLQKDHGYKPVYWIGYDTSFFNDNAREQVSKNFPDCIYHAFYDAWKGIFPEETQTKYSISYQDVDFLKRNAHHELMTIKMMDRLDSDTHSFSFMERQRHYRNLIRRWQACLDLIKPDIVISAVVPHRIYDYVLYIICKESGIPYISLRPSNFTVRAIPVTNVATIGDYLTREYDAIKSVGMALKDLREAIDKEILDRFDAIKTNYQQAEPDYMKSHRINDKGTSSLFKLAVKLLTEVFRNIDTYFGKEGYLRKGIPHNLKHPARSIENSELSLARYSLLRYKSLRYKKSLNQKYSELSAKPNLNAMYVVFFLHYQPEMTSNPSGDIFVDQILAVEMLAKNLPNEYTIYVKEHPSQFYSHTDGHTSRIAEFYDDLLSISGVKLVPLDTDPFLLIKHSRAVSSITGTAGWEAMVHGKPVICFGLSWYEGYNGVLRVTDEHSASKISSFIQEYRYDEPDLLAYLAAFSKNAVKAYFYRGQKEKSNLSEAECVENLSRAIVETVGSSKA